MAIDQPRQRKGWLLSASVSAILNFHREGSLARPAINSAIAAANHACTAGLEVEIICVLDCEDHATRSLVTSFGSQVRVVQTTCADLAAARNLGASSSSSEFVAFLDGDDLWGSQWLTSAARTILSVDSPDVVVHPQLNMYFSRHATPYYWLHSDMRYDRIGADNLVVTNPWTALSFARRSLFVKYPYIRNELQLGFGYEDWGWHARTISAGVLHVAAPGTIHFIRRKATGSLLAQTNQARSLPRLR